MSLLNEAELAHVRNKQIGFVFQSFHLLPRVNVIENVELPLIYAKVSRSDRTDRAKSILVRLGLEEKIYNYPNQLSGGQQQRVAIARAMVADPDVLLADEPTGSLDQKTGREIIDIFSKLNLEGKTIVMITHDHDIARSAGRTVEILDGRLVEGGSSDV